jgi:hypothetical protein
MFLEPREQRVTTAIFKINLQQYHSKEKVIDNDTNWTHTCTDTERTLQLARTKLHYIQLSTDFNIGYQERRKCFDSIVKKKNMHTLILATKKDLKT